MGKLQVFWTFNSMRTAPGMAAATTSRSFMNFIVSLLRKFDLEDCQD